MAINSSPEDKPTAAKCNDLLATNYDAGESPFRIEIGDTERFDALQGITDDDGAVVNGEDGHIVVKNGVEFDDGEGRATVFKFGDVIEGAVFADQSCTAIVFLQGPGENVGWRAGGGRSVGKESEFAFIGLDAKFPERGNGRSRPASVIGGLVANAIAINTSDERPELFFVESRGEDRPDGNPQNGGYHQRGDGETVAPFRQLQQRRG